MNPSHHDRPQNNPREWHALNGASHRPAVAVHDQNYPEKAINQWVVRFLRGVAENRRLIPKCPSFRPPVTAQTPMQTRVRIALDPCGHRLGPR